MQPRLILFDQTLRSQLGHMFECARLTLAAARQAGFETLLVIPEDADQHVSTPDSVIDRVLPARSDPASAAASAPEGGSLTGLGLGRRLPTRVRTLVNGTVSRLAGPFLNERERIRVLSTTGRAFAAWLQRAQLRPTDFLLFQTLLWEEAVAVCDAWREAGPPPGARLCLLMRHDPPHGTYGRALLAKAGRVPGLIWTSDTDLLARAHASILRQPVTTVQVPIDLAALDRLRGAGHDRGPGARVIYLGEARLEKGFDCLPLICERLLRHGPDNLRLTIQTATAGADSSATADLAAAMYALRKMEADSDGRLSLIETALDSDSFNRHVVDADVLIAPYAADSYRLRSSGTIVTALAAGLRIVSCSQPSWISRTLLQYGAPGQVRLTPHDPQAYADAVLDLLRTPALPVAPSAFICALTESPWPWEVSAVRRR